MESIPMMKVFHVEAILCTLATVASPAGREFAVVVTFPNSTGGRSTQKSQTHRSLDSSWSLRYGTDTPRGRRGVVRTYRMFTNFPSHRTHTCRFAGWKTALRHRGHSCRDIARPVRRCGGLPGRVQRWKSVRGGLYRTCIDHCIHTDIVGSCKNVLSSLANL